MDSDESGHSEKWFYHPEEEAFLLNSVMLYKRHILVPFSQFEKKSFREKRIKEVTNNIFIWGVQGDADEMEWANLSLHLNFPSVLFFADA